MSRFLVTLSVVVVCVLVARFAYAWSVSFTAGQGAVTIQIQGIIGPCGYLSGAGTGANYAEGVYGHDVDGICCPTNSDTKSSTNYLTATFQETDGESHSYTISAKTTMSLISYNNAAQHEPTCQVGSFTYTGSSVIALSDPAAGTTGSPYSSWTSSITLGGGLVQDNNKHSSGIKTIPWIVDSQDPGTATFVVSAKVQVDFSGTASDCVCNHDKHKAKCKLEITGVAGT